MQTGSEKITIAVHKFSSCDGCQLAFLNSVNAILQLSQWIDIKHFAEAGPCDPEARVDIAFVEGSIATAKDVERIKMVRDSCQFLVSIGACATSGGIQALRNMASHDAWRKAVYASPEHIRSLDTSTPIAAHVKVDYELWGCPVDGHQLLQSIQAWLLGGKPETEFDSVCSECKRHNNSCVMVTQQRPCLGPVTRAGCGAICPSFNRDCYGCFGPAHLSNTASLSKWFELQGSSKKDIAHRFLQINSQAETFKAIGLNYKHADE